MMRCGFSDPHSALAQNHKFAGGFGVINHAEGVYGIRNLLRYGIITK